MKQFYAFLICIVLSGCGVLSPQPTPTPTSTPTPAATKTPLPDLAATRKAEQAATQTRVAENNFATLTQRAAPTATARAQAADMLSEIKAAAAVAGDVDVDFDGAKFVYGPREYSLVQKNDKYVEVFSADLSQENFIISITFINPFDTSTTGNWDYGIFFRDADDEGQYRLVILSNQTWTLIDSKKKSYIDSNASQSITSKGGEKNTVWLVVSGEKAYLFINGVYMRSLNVSRVLSGDIMPATGIYYGNAKAQKKTTFQDFMVWSLP